MNMVCVNEGKKYCLKRALNGNDPVLTPYSVRLYKNDYTPVEASALGNFTEADFPGYSAFVFAQDEFNDPVIVADIAYSNVTDYPQYTCTGGTGQLVYGWFMVEVDFNTVLFAQRFDTPRNMVPGAVEALNPFEIALKTLG